MAGQNNANFPVQGADANVLITAINSVWGQEGAGSFDFWKTWGSYVYRDSASGTGLESLDAIYDLVTSSGLRYEYKGEFEKRSSESNYGIALVGPVRTERIDGPRVLFNTVKPGGQRSAKLRQAVERDMRLWADMLPLIQLTSLLVNGRLSTKHATISGTGHIYTKGSAFFATNHRVNPMDETNTTTFSNLITLAKPIDDIGWASAKDTIIQIPDFDGKYLPNAIGMRPMRLMVATTVQYLRWARFLGGDAGVALARQHLQMDPSGTAAISSVMVGDAEIMINPYLLTLAESGNLATVRKRTFCFPGGGGRAPMIWREAVPPIIKVTGPSDSLAHDFNAESAYIQAETGASWGEPRSLIAIDEPAA